MGEPWRLKLIKWIEKNPGHTLGDACNALRFDGEAHKRLSENIPYGWEFVCHGGLGNSSAHACRIGKGCIYCYPPPGGFLVPIPVYTAIAPVEAGCNSYPGRPPCLTEQDPTKSTPTSGAESAAHLDERSDAEGVGSHSLPGFQESLDSGQQTRTAEIEPPDSLDVPTLPPVDLDAAMAAAKKLGGEATAAFERVWAQL